MLQTTYGEFSDEVKKIIFEIELQISLEKMKLGHTKEWTPEYAEGFITGLKRTIEIILDISINTHNE